MPTEAFSDSPFIVNGKTINEAYKELLATNLDKHKAGLIAVGAVLENLRGTRRRFNYDTAAPSVDIVTKYSFSRTFVHDDWIDGESVVQAESSAAEDGFNDRFHKIESDLDALGLQVRTALQCIEEIRKSFIARTDEIRGELNYLNSLHDEEAPVWSGPVKIPRYDFDHSPPIRAHMPKNPVYKGISKIDGVDMAVWNSTDGMVMLPVVGDFNFGQIDHKKLEYREKIGGELASFLAENESEIAPSFRNGSMTKEKFVKSFGQKEIGGGLSIDELVSILPAGAKYETPAALLAAVTESQAAAMRSEPGAKEAVRKQMGLSLNTESLGKAAVEKLKGIDPQVAKVLESNDIKTVEDLAAKSPKEMEILLKRNNLNLSIGRITELQGRAGVLLRM